MDRDERQFFSGLPFFVIGSLDCEAMPWASIVVGEGKPGFLSSPSANALLLKTRITVLDPLFANLKDGYMERDPRYGESVPFAGLAIDFENRQRVKVAGRIPRDGIELDNGPVYVDARLKLIVEETLGNCPKYINARRLDFKQRRARASGARNLKSDSLDAESRLIIDQADAVFIATRHLSGKSEESGISRVDLNHRGGRPGFLRTSEDGTTIYWPDYSGNRIYSTMGNIQSDGTAGIVVPSFSSGDILYLTGKATVLVAKHATAVMPRCQVVVRLVITSSVLIREGLNLEGSIPAVFSPYNPPVRYLTDELERMGRRESPEHRQRIHIVSAALQTETIASFTFKTDDPIRFLPGQYAVLDFSDEKTTGYQHMNDRNPQLLNDDFIRTWTISSSPPLQKDGAFASTNRFTCTIKLVKRGQVTPLLFQHCFMAAGNRKFGSDLRISFVATGGEFSCFDPAGNLLTPKMLWIAAGSGITPMLSFWRGIRDRHLHPEIIVLYSSKVEDQKIVNMLAADGELKLSLFRTSPLVPEHGDPARRVHGRRMNEQDIRDILNLPDYSVYLCGPLHFMADVTGWLRDAGLPPSRIKRESYAY